MTSPNNSLRNVRKSSYVTSFFVCQRFGPSDQDYYYKKCDEPQPDSPQDPEGNTTNFTDNGSNI